MRNGRAVDRENPFLYTREKRVTLIGTRSADHIRASGHAAATTGRTHDLHPTASRTPNSSCNAGVVHTCTVDVFGGEVAHRRDGGLQSIVTLRANCGGLTRESRRGVDEQRDRHGARQERHFRAWIRARLSLDCSGGHGQNERNAVQLCDAHRVFLADLGSRGERTA